MAQYSILDVLEASSDVPITVWMLLVPFSSPSPQKASTDCLE